MKALKYVGRFFIIFLITVAFIFVALLAVIFALEKGPSESAKVLFVTSVNETSRMGFLGNLFLSDEEVKEILRSSSMTEVDAGTTSDKNLIDVNENASEDIEIIDVSGGSYQGKLMIVHDPSRVFCGTVPEFGTGTGQTVSDMIDTYNSNGYSIIGGVNGGDFVDNGANTADTSQPLGAVYSEGQLVYEGYPSSGETDENGNYIYHLCGLTNDNILVLGNMTIAQANELGIRDAMYCVHETGPFLIMDGEALVDSVPNSATYGGGKNPRTAIGQTEDGSILLLTIDGRQSNSLGATFKDMVYIMLEYGAVNAACMDGGTSTQMVYEGEILNNPYSPTGPRRCPTAWLVKAQED